MPRLPKIIVVILVGETAALFVLGGLLLVPRLTERSSNILPGQTDYPAVNSQAAQEFQVDLLIPSSLNLDFHAVYAATFGRDSSPKPTGCHYITRQGTETEYSVSQTEFSVDVPLAKVFVGDEPDQRGRSPKLKRYRADVLVDRFHPGRCLWALDRITYRPQGSSMDSDLVHVGPSDGRHESHAVNLWCTSVPASREQPAHQACAGPGPGPLEPIDITLFPSDHSYRWTFSADTRIEFDFNDVDNLLPVTVILPAESK